jgi:hypothetical protein
MTDLICLNQPGLLHTCPRITAMMRKDENKAAGEDS